MSIRGVLIYGAHLCFVVRLPCSYVLAEPQTLSVCVAPLLFLEGPQMFFGCVSKPEMKSAT